MNVSYKVWNFFFLFGLLIFFVERVREKERIFSLGHVLFRGLTRATIGPVGLRPHFLNRGPRPGPIVAAKTRP